MINFVENNVTLLKDTLKKGYEEIMGVKVVEGDPVTDFIGWLVYIITTSNESINYTGNMNLVSFAKGKYLDALGELVGVERLDETYAKTTIEYKFSKEFDEVVVIPAGHLVGTENITFLLEEDIRLEIGETITIGKVRCSTPGDIGNGYKVGDINKIINDIPYLEKIENITISSGGNDIEDDDGFRDRIKMKPYSYSTAGPINSYKYYVLEASSEISDVFIDSPNPGEVDVYILLENGVIPQDEILDIVTDSLSDDVRPFTDKVEVKKPVGKSYNIELEWWGYNNSDNNKLKNKIEDGVIKYKKWQKQKLGRDINPDKLMHYLMNTGIKRAKIISPVYTKLENIQIAQDSAITIRYMGDEDE